MSAYLIPVFILFVFLFALLKKGKPYDSFVKGAKNAVPFVLSIFPNLLCIFILSSVLEVSGISDFLTRILTPVFSFFGIPSEVCKLVLIKPFSGSGALGTLSEIYATFGADGYIARCASAIYGSSETVFYVSAVYFANSKRKNLFTPITISLVASFFSVVFACFICKVV